MDVTRLEHQQVPDDVYETVSKVFSEEERVALTLAVVEINGWNRFAISFKRPVGASSPNKETFMRTKILAILVKNIDKPATMPVK